MNIPAFGLTKLPNKDTTRKPMHIDVIVVRGGNDESIVSHRTIGCFFDFNGNSDLYRVDNLFMGYDEILFNKVASRLLIV